jgi:SAM-dependent methyltransferase
MGSGDVSFAATAARTYRRDMGSILFSTIGTLAGAVVGITVLSTRAARHLRKPEDRAGRAVLQRMNVSHAPLTAWGLDQLEIHDDFIVLDIGCGGGRTIDRLAAVVSKGKVFGIDYSEESVAAARATNGAWIEQGHVDIQLGSVSQLPYADATFDLVTAVETHYYWPNLQRDVAGVERVLKPGGTFLIVAETYRGRTNDWLYRPTMTLVLRANYLTPEQHRELLVNAGLVVVRVIVDQSKGWIAAMGKRPAKV